MDAIVKTPRTGIQQRYVIDDTSKVGEARRAAQTMANYEFDVETAGKVAIVATEMANNLLLHAGGGELLIQTLTDGQNAIVELLAIDRGKGMENISKCLTDGYSTIGTPGTGLGAIKRLAREFDIHSVPDEGTVVMARFGTPLALRYGAVNVALEGEIECGDAWSIAHGDDGIAAFMIDGLGHGSFAAEAARVAVAAFESNVFSTPHEVMVRANSLMSKTRGGAGACARIKGNKLSYAGVGNISGALVSSGRSQGLVSHNGTLGLNQKRTQQFEYKLEPSDLLVMHSDGISARGDLRNRPDILATHPAIIAAFLYREYSRGRDDATVLVVAP
jgi:anti-sigma regulatory factor (Ser/Thr protein kinase)